jgi:hypothetical protein
MKKLPILLFLFLLANSIIAQKVKSTCNAHDSTLAKYKNDADRLAIRRVFQSGSSYIDSSAIPKHWSDTMLNALIAVYNADSLPARDTVISLINIHTFQQPVLNSFFMAADSNLQWMQKLRKDSLPTGIDSADYLIKKYQLKVARYYRIKEFPYHIIILQSKLNYNMEVVTNLFDSLSGVNYANISKVEGDGNDIKATIGKDYIELLYSYGWGDCFNGCIYKRYWKFKIYNDCSVSYLGSYGSKLIPNSLSHFSAAKITPSPNPFQSKIILQNVSTPFQYKLYNSFGQIIKVNTISEPAISNLDDLPLGMYTLQIISNNKTSYFKLLKN